MKRVSSLLALISILNVILSGVTAAQQEGGSNSPIPALFTAAPRHFASEPLPVMVQQRNDIRQIRRVDVNFSALQTDQQQIMIDLFDGRQVIAVHERTEPHSLFPGGYSWVGKIVDDPYSLVTLTVGGGQMVGEINPLGEKYQVFSTGAGHVLVEADVNLPLTPNGDSDAIPISAPVSYSASRDRVQVDASRLSSPVQIDQVMLYTADARSSAGGVTQILNLIQGAAATANQQFINSDINVQLNIVHAAETNYVGVNAFADVTRLRNPNDGYLDEIHALRDTYQGDLGGLIVGTPPGTAGACGIAYLMGSPGAYFENYAFNWVALGCLVGRTLGHEVGHNLGSNHNREQYTTFNTGSYSYSYGYRVPGGFSTVMSYQTGCAAQPCPPIPYFSQPDRSVNGQPIGRADANNVLSINQTAAIVASFRPVLPLPTETNLIVEPDFEPFREPWDGSLVLLNAEAGILNVTTLIMGAYISQPIVNGTIPPDTRFQWSIDIANPTDTAQTVSLILADTDIMLNGSLYSLSCTFTVSAHTGFQRYSLHGALPVAWTGLQNFIQFPMTVPNLSIAAPDLRVRPSQAPETTCTSGESAMATVSMTVTFQGRSVPPTSMLVMPLDVTITPSGESAAVYDGTFFTDTNGRITLHLVPGNYDVRVKGDHTLSRVATIPAVSGANSVSFGTLKEGDADDDNQIILSDFSLLAGSFGKATGQSGFDARTDFNGDGAVTLIDFSLLASNYGQQGQDE